MARAEWRRMSFASRSPADLERWLLRRGVGALVADRTTCASCHRTPLLGEKVHLYDGGRMLCELCRRRRRESPVSSESVRSPEWGHGVRPAAAA